MATELRYNAATGESDVVEIPAPSLSAQKAAKRSALADIRWQHETGGISLGGLAVATDRETQTIVDRIVKAYADGDITGTVKFKRGPGDWIEIDAATASAIKAAGAVHVQTCFAHECDLDGQIEAAADEAALNAIDIGAGWP